MQINRAELQKVRVKLSRDALTIQKEGTGSVSPSSSSPVNQPEVGLHNLFDTFLVFLSQFSGHWTEYTFNF